MHAPLGIGIDDTDSPLGGCTTYTLTEVIRSARELGADLVGEPSLVRLNPNVPTKTRGNAALAARFGHGRGTRRLQGRDSDGPIWSYASGRPLSRVEAERLVETAWASVLRSSRRGEPGTGPVLIATDRRLGRGLYAEAVARWVDVGPLESGLRRDDGVDVRTDGDPQGLVGAAAALAWPALRGTWELIAYRPPPRWGRPREVNGESVRAIARKYPDLFLCHDPGTRRLLVAPHTACPILFGLRSVRRGPLARAAAGVESEPVERWLIFRTNQGTGDHLVRRTAAELRPYDAARLSGRVAGSPERLPGGHVRFRLVEPTGASVDCIAFEPTKLLPSVARDLATGDRLDVWGGRGSDPVFRVEGIRILGRARRRGPPSPPTCPACQRAAHSRGRTRGYRCPGCGRRFAPEAARWPARPVWPTGTYHPTPSARRHLAPLDPVRWRMPGAGGVDTDLYAPRPRTRGGGR